MIPIYSTLMAEETKKEKEETIAFTVRFPRDFLWDYDVAYQKNNFATRNEAIRAACRDQMAKWKRGQK